MNVAAEAAEMLPLLVLVEDDGVGVDVEISGALPATGGSGLVVAAGGVGGGSTGPAAGV